MARDFEIGEKVFVPSSRITELEAYPTAFYETRVADVANRSIKVNVPGQGISDWIGVGLCHRNVAILVISIGDLETESTLLDPLAKSVLQFCRLLVPDDYLRFYKIRSIAELSGIWRREQAAFSHVVLIGHGSATGVKFYNDGWVRPDALEVALRVRPAVKKVFISLCCETGKNSFSIDFSNMTTCSHLIAPFHAVHGAAASQFAQTFLTYHLLEGESVGVAMRHASESVPGSKKFRLWEKGVLKAGPRR